MEKHFNTMDHNQAYERVKQLKSFYKNLIWFGIIAGILFFDDYIEHGEIDLSFYHGSIILLIWGIILTIKAFKLFVFDSDWEQRLIDKELNKEKTKL
jgi:hypothetical protein